jgi:hypothetical protein
MPHFMGNLLLVARPQQSGSNSGLGGAINNIVNEALQGVRSEMQAKLEQLQEQRADLAQQLRGADTRAEQLRIQGRIDRLDRQIAETGDAINKLSTREAPIAPRINVPAIPTTTPPPTFPPMPRIDPVPIIGTTLGILFVAFPLALTISRYIWKRSTHAPLPAITAEQAKRFDRLEQSVDAIAIEVERISENQRYLTKLLGESKSSAKIGA